MHIFEYPYVIITILVMIIILMGLIGLYFTVKSVRTSKETAAKGFCGLGKIENDFERAGKRPAVRGIVYISASLGGIKRIYSDAGVSRIYEQIKRILLKHFGISGGGEISLYGTDHFVALSMHDAEGTGHIIENCYKEIHESLIKYGAVNTVHLHFGYHCTSATDIEFKTALSRAKQACSIAEDKNMINCMWDSSNGKEFERKVKIENNINNEIDNNKFFLEYQPILDVSTGKIMGAEVLARLNSSTEGVLTPYHFLSAVNNVGLNEKFDYYIFEKNCKWIASDKEKREKYVYTINFSRSTLCDTDFADRIIDIAEKYGISYSSIAVEILEDKNLKEDEKRIMINNLLVLKKKGLMILLDDFGKGYANFGDLTDFDISIVKIDKAITQNAVTQTGFLILKNIIRTAHDLGFRTLCEGIETPEHKEAVINAGCDLLQGYYFYRPMPVTKLEALFENE